MYFSVASRIFVFETEERRSMTIEDDLGKFSFQKFFNPRGHNITFTLLRRSHLSSS